MGDEREIHGDFDGFCECFDENSPMKLMFLRNTNRAFNFYWECFDDFIMSKWQFHQLLHFSNTPISTLGVSLPALQADVGHSIMVWLNSKEVTIHATPQMRLIQVVSCCNSPRYTLHGLSNKTTLANIGQLWFIPGIYMFFRRA